MSGTLQTQKRPGEKVNLHGYLGAMAVRSAGERDYRRACEVADEALSRIQGDLFRPERLLDLVHEISCYVYKAGKEEIYAELADYCIGKISRE